MIRLLTAALLCLVSTFLFAEVPSPGEPAAVAEWFARALRDGNLREIERAHEPGSGNLKEVRDLLDKYECLSVEVIDSKSSSSRDSVIVSVHLRGSGLTHAEWRPRAALPDRWQLELRQQSDASFRLRSVMTAERATALCMLSEPSTRGADRVFTETQADPLRTILTYEAELSAKEHRPRFASLMEHALVLARECESPAVEVQVLRDYGYFGTDRKVASPLDIVHRGVDVARASGDPDSLLNALTAVGLVHFVQHRFNEAIVPYAEAGSLIERLEDPIRGLKAEYMHGVVLVKAKRHFEAIRSSDRVMTLSKKYGWREGENVVLFTKAEALHDLGNLESAIEVWREAAARARAQGSRDHAAMALHNVALMLGRLDKPDLAIASIREALDVAPPGWPARSTLTNHLAGLQIAVGDLAAAEVTLREAEKLMNPANGNSVARWMLLRSTFLRVAGKPEEALGAAREAADRLENDIGGKAVILTEVGRALRELGRREEAMETFHSAIDTTEIARRQNALEESKIAFFREHLGCYRDLMDMLAEREDTTAEALRVAERIKARTLLEVSTGGGASLTSRLSQEEREREKTLSDRVTELNRALLRRDGIRETRTSDAAALEAARYELAGFRSEMRAKYPFLAQRDIAIPAQLPLPDADAVEFVVDEKKTTAFIVPSARSGKKISAITIPIERRALTDRIERYLRALSNRSLAYRTDARALYDTLVAPLAPFLPAEGRLYVIPDGPLWSVPFHTLIDANGVHLAERRAVALAPSLAVIHAQRPRPEAAATLLAFGNPQTGRATRDNVRAIRTNIPVGALPESEDEVRAIAKLHDSDAVHVGADATESSFKREAAKYKILHLATHGFVSATAPLYSGLVFRDDAENDGILEAREVAEMTLGADLAVLSACDTAAGQINDGEGVVGLSWAFLAAGCPTTVVSQWKADSAATAKLMIEFHRQLAQNHSPAEALRRAQKSLMGSEAYWHPYYWAPFIVVGRDRHLN